MSFGKRQPMGFRGVERRRHARQSSSLAARIILAAGQTVKCQITDFSRSSARLLLPSAFGVPDEFDLRAAGRVYHVRIARRATGHVAVIFT
jgi:hypothetical protein